MSDPVTIKRTVPCMGCSGTGKVKDAPCAACKGTGTIQI